MTWDLALEWSSSGWDVFKVVLISPSRTRPGSLPLLQPSSSDTHPPRHCMRSGWSSRHHEREAWCFIYRFQGWSWLWISKYFTVWLTSSTTSQQKKKVKSGEKSLPLAVFTPAAGTLPEAGLSGLLGAAVCSLDNLEHKAGSLSSMARAQGKGPPALHSTPQQKLPGRKAGEYLRKWKNK